MLQKTCFQDLNFTQYKSLKPRSKNDTYPNFIVNVSHKCEEMIVSCIRADQSTLHGYISRNFR